MFKKLKQLEKVNGRLAMGGLVYLLFTKLVSSHADILNQLKSILILLILDIKFFKSFFVKSKLKTNLNIRK